MPHGSPVPMQLFLFNFFGSFSLGKENPDFTKPSMSMGIRTQAESINGIRAVTKNNSSAKIGLWTSWFRMYPLHSPPFQSICFSYSYFLVIPLTLDCSFPHLNLTFLRLPNSTLVIFILDTHFFFFLFFRRLSQKTPPILYKHVALIYQSFSSPSFWFVL